MKCRISIKVLSRVLNHVPTNSGAFEAEAAAAKLEQDGLVDGVITTDGDAFLYGARQVCLVWSFWYGVRI